MPRRKSAQGIARQTGRLQNRVWNELRQTTDPTRRQTLQNRLNTVNSAGSRYLNNIFNDPRFEANIRRAVGFGSGRMAATDRAERVGYGRNSYMGNAMGNNAG